MSKPGTPVVCAQIGGLGVIRRRARLLWRGRAGRPRRFLRAVARPLKPAPAERAERPLLRGVLGSHRGIQLMASQRLSCFHRRTSISTVAARSLLRAESAHLRMIAVACTPAPGARLCRRQKSWRLRSPPGPPAGPSPTAQSCVCMTISGSVHASVASGLHGAYALRARDVTRVRAAAPGLRAHRRTTRPAPRGLVTATRSARWSRVPARRQGRAFGLRFAHP